MVRATCCAQLWGMIMIKSAGIRAALLALGLAMVLTAGISFAAGPSADQIVKGSFDHMRGKASVSTVTMTIHRPDWQRKMVMKAWTKGQADSIFFITSPPKDAGNGTLKKGAEMWLYNPKVNRVIKLPPSMMAQSWMGSDFSNNDLAKSDSIINDYIHKIIGTETVDGKKVYSIQSTPKPDAPVIWGMQKLKIREDNVFLQQDFFDESKQLVKSLSFLQIKKIGDRLYPTKWKMVEAANKDKYTVLIYDTLEFKDDLPGRLFTLANLRNPRD